MAIAWLLKDERITSVLVGVSTADQIKSNAKGLNHLHFDQSELEQIESILE